MRDLAAAMTGLTARLAAIEHREQAAAATRATAPPPAAPVRPNLDTRIIGNPDSPEAPWHGAIGR